MFGESCDPKVEEALFVLLVITTPFWVSLGIGSLSGLFLSQMRVFPGATVGLVVGTVSEVCFIWALVQWRAIPLFSIPWGIAVLFGGVATFGICWWMNQREAKKEHLPQIDAPLGCT